MYKDLECATLNLVENNFKDTKVLKRNKVIDVFAKDKRFLTTKIKDILVYLESNGYVINA